MLPCNFLKACKTEGTIPKGLSLKPLYFSFKAKQIVTIASRTLLQDRLNFHHSNKIKLKNCIDMQRVSLSTEIGSV